MLLYTGYVAIKPRQEKKMTTSKAGNRIDIIDYRTHKILAASIREANQVNLWCDHNGYLQHHIGRKGIYVISKNH